MLPGLSSGSSSPAAINPPPYCHQQALMPRLVVPAQHTRSSRVPSRSILCCLLRGTAPALALLAPVNHPGDADVLQASIPYAVEAWLPLAAYAGSLWWCCTDASGYSCCPFERPTPECCSCQCCSCQAGTVDRSAGSCLPMLRGMLVRDGSALSWQRPRDASTQPLVGDAAGYRPLRAEGMR